MFFKLSKSFLEVLADSDRVPARIVFLNSGVFLTTEGSPVLGQLKKLAESGTEILSCGTCLDYYDRRNKLEVGHVGNMNDTVGGMTSFDKVITL